MRVNTFDYSEIVQLLRINHLKKELLFDATSMYADMTIVYLLNSE